MYTTTLTAPDATRYADAFDAADSIADDGSITLELERDLEGDQLAVIEIPEDVETKTRVLYADTYLVAMPPEYDWEIVTGADILEDEWIYIIRGHGPAGTITRYTVEFRKDHGDPWQEAEPGLDRDERYPATEEEAREAIRTLREIDEREGRQYEYRADTIEFGADEWGDA